jgi:hypothetical protein
MAHGNRTGDIENNMWNNMFNNIHLEPNRKRSDFAICTVFTAYCLRFLLDHTYIYIYCYLFILLLFKY